MSDTKLRIWLGKLAYILIRPLVYVAEALKISPNILTTIGFALNIITAMVYIKGAWAEPNQITAYIGYGSAMLLFASCFDLLDGLIARKLNKMSDFGAFYDSVLDRYSDLIIYSSIGFALLTQEQKLGALLCLLSMIAAIMISYTAARAASFNIKVERGWMPRETRVMWVGVFGCICGVVGHFTNGNINVYSNGWIKIDIASIFLFALATIAFFGQITVFQRIKSAYKALN